MKYVIKTFNDWTHPYFFSEGDKRPIREKETVEQETDSADLAVTIVKDWLDAPDRDMTHDDVRKEFDSDIRRIGDEYVTQIMNYYNGRRALFLRFKEEFSNIGPGGVLKYPIPYELNHFETEPFDPDYNETQNEAYFQVSAED